MAEVILPEAGGPREPANVGSATATTGVRFETVCGVDCLQAVLPLCHLGYKKLPHVNRKRMNTPVGISVTDTNSPKKYKWSVSTWKDVQIH